VRGIDKLAKIFVFSQEDPLLAKRQIHDGGVIGAERQLGNSHHIVARKAKRSNHEKSQLSSARNRTD
jgi:hypothetical protein